ncbi:MAG: hypothetical protein FWC32_07835 [Firmicutes bacterium]|nr:hypothetical protein [Bacillota bacterium]
MIFDEREVKKVQILYWIFSVVGTAVVVYMMREISIHFYLRLLLIPAIFMGFVILVFPVHVVIMFIKTLIITPIMWKKWRALAPIKENDCDVIKYIEELQLLVESKHGRKYLKPNPALWLPVSLEFAHCYHYNGENDKAEEITKEVLDSIEASIAGKKMNIFLTCMAIQTLTGLYIYKSELEKAREYYAYLPEYYAVVSAWKANAKTRQMLDLLNKCIKELDNGFLIAKGKFSEALPFYLKEWENSENIMLNKVRIQYNLSLIYEGLGEDEKYKESLTYVARHGNNTFMARMAREKLG